MSCERRGVKGKGKNAVVGEMAKCRQSEAVRKKIFWQNLILALLP